MTDMTHDETLKKIAEAYLLIRIMVFLFWFVLGALLIASTNKRNPDPLQCKDLYRTSSPHVLLEKHCIKRVET